MSGVWRAGGGHDPTQYAIRTFFVLAATLMICTVNDP